MDTKIKVPHLPKPRVLLWVDASFNDMEEIDKMQSLPDLESALGRVFRVEAPEPRRGVLLELYVRTVLFCRRNGFNRAQTSALLSITRRVHEANIDTSLNNTEQCLEYCSELLLCHSVRRPPFSVDLYSYQEVARILEYIQGTYIRHHNLYKYIFTPQVRLDLSLVYHGMPEEAHLNTEDSESPEEGKELEKDLEMGEGKDGPSEPQEPPTAEPEVTTPGSRSELTALIQQAVEEEVTRVSVHLEQRLKESEEQLNTALASLQLNLQGRK
ncbi:coiled-coil domain-containing protein 189 [Lampris incognitus]|uniref:coiled-coil domain-containing protein 189 n=1 Tax=Lampris incognitus TaxID=2546036 RepID=UPI0024B4CC50|nr:coiled-coil domain-containing protein 189 [Lampris incognitus]